MQFEKEKLLLERERLEKEERLKRETNEEAYLQLIKLEVRI